MLRLSRPAVLLASASMVTGLLAGPGAAYAADTTTNLTAAEMTAALKSVATMSAAAAADGWKLALDIHMGNEGAASGLMLVDPADAMAYNEFTYGAEADAGYFVQGKGVYGRINTSPERQALKMMGRSSVQYSFTADRTLTLADITEGTDPGSMLAEDTDHAGSKTVHDDGTADYSFIDEDGLSVTAHVDTAGKLSGLEAQMYTMHEQFDYTYGAQQVTPPAAAVTISDSVLALGVAYLDMPAAVKSVATSGAAAARKAACGHTVKVASLRKAVRGASAKVKGVNVVKVANVRGGVKVYATNPWTHASVAYTVKASGRKVVVKKA